jgi:predicted transposase YdaD
VLQCTLHSEELEAVMTGAERLLEQGRAEGEAKGEVKGRIELVLKLLTLRFGPLSGSVDARVRAASIAELDSIAERVLSASSLDDVLQ